MRPTKYDNQVILEGVDEFELIRRKLAAELPPTTDSDEDRYITRARKLERVADTMISQTEADTPPESEPGTADTPEWLIEDKVDAMIVLGIVRRLARTDAGEDSALAARMIDRYDGLAG